MIYSLRGKIITRDKNFAVLEAAGVGYKIYVGKKFFDKLKINEEIKIFVYLYLKQDSLELYGFEKERELEYFEILNEITRIGPKIALKILSATSIENLEKAVLENDLEFLVKTCGLGKKSSQRIILELKEKISAYGRFSEGGKDSTGDNKERKTVFEILKNLGYKTEEIREVLSKLKEDLSLEEKIKEAIKILNLR